MTMHDRPITRTRRPIAASGGFSLIEIMVGIVIAMIGVLIMMEVLITSERQTSRTGAGNDAMSNGAIMMYELEHDLTQAGYGINTYAMLGCNLTVTAGRTVTLAPFVINPPTTLLPAGDANTDNLIVLYGNDSGEPEGNIVYSVSGTAYLLQAPSSFHVGDRVIGFNGSCATALTLATVTAVDATTVTADSALSSATVLYNLGPTPTIAGYRVRSGALESCSYITSDCTTNGSQWQQVSSNIVSLRAQYGVDTAASGAMDGQVDTWNQTTPTTACGWVRAPAMRLAIVARSDVYETKIDSTTKQRVCDTVTTTAPTWNGTTSAPIVLSGNTTWQCYRYQTFENVIPARNVIWMGTQAGC